MPTNIFRPILIPNVYIIFPIKITLYITKLQQSHASGVFIDFTNSMHLSKKLFLTLINYFNLTLKL
jgi:hypothetical protein